VLRLLFRAIGLVLLAGAFAAAVIDGARSLADQQLALTPMGQLLAYAFPVKFALVPALARKVHPMLWDPVLVSILYVPAFVDLAVLGVILMLIARPRAADAMIGARR
jgi:hypothetical protein